MVCAVSCRGGSNNGSRPRNSHLVPAASGAPAPSASAKPKARYPLHTIHGVLPHADEPPGSACRMADVTVSHAHRLERQPVYTSWQGAKPQVRNCSLVAAATQTRLSSEQPNIHKLCCHSHRCSRPYPRMPASYHAWGSADNNAAKSILKLRKHHRPCLLVPWLSSSPRPA
jgi:hypothetical protein